MGVTSVVGGCRFGRVKDMVIDPSLHDKPVLIGDWKKRMNDPRSVLEITDSSPYYRAIGDNDKRLDFDQRKTTKQLKQHDRICDQLNSDAVRK